MLLYYYNNLDEYIKFKMNYYNDNLNDVNVKQEELYIVDEIIEIEEIGEEFTIDIEVDGDRLFICNDVLVHNSAMGDMTDVTEEHIQGGVTKTQTADNVIAIIPSSAHRQANMMHMKLLKTRDSGGVWKTLKFIVDWERLKIIPNLTKDEIEKLEKFKNQCEYEFYNDEKKIMKKDKIESCENYSKKNNEEDDGDGKNDGIKYEKLKEKLIKKKKKSKLVKIDVRKQKESDTHSDEDDIIDESSIEITEELDKNNPFSKKKKKLSVFADEDLSILGKGK